MPAETVNLPCVAMERDLRRDMRHSIWKYRQLPCSQHHTTRSKIKWRRPGESGRRSPTLPFPTLLSPACRTYSLAVSVDFGSRNHSPKKGAGHVQDSILFESRSCSSPVRISAAGATEKSPSLRIKLLKD